MRFFVVLFVVCFANPSIHGEDPQTSVPTLYLIGDSTVKNGTKGQQGWGDPFAELFDQTKLKVENRARGGRSSRTFLTEGLWDQVESKLKPGDFLIVQFGHNDGGSLTDARGRASIKGNSDETREVDDPKTGKPEVIHSYGWYLRQYITRAKAKGAAVIIVSPVPRNIWRDGKVNRASNDYGKWVVEAANQAGASFIDLNNLVALCYEKAGPEVVKSQYFGTDHTHTTPVGASLTAIVLARDIKARVDDFGFSLRSAINDIVSISVDEKMKNFLFMSHSGPLRKFKFDLGSGKTEPGYLPATSATVFPKEGGHGFDLGSKVEDIDRGGNDPLRSDFCTSDKPFFFSVSLPEGSYDVTVTLGDREQGSTTTIKAESRRLMLERVSTQPGEFVTRTFTVHVRRPQMASGGEVKLNEREQATLTWDQKLTLEFGDVRPCVCAIVIAPSVDPTTVYLVGDSTVTDQPSEPWNSWGQMLPRFFKRGVAVTNYAESGEALRRFVAEKRLAKVFSTIRPGDYLLIQFGHNDQKERGENVGAFTTYSESLKTYIHEARRLGAIPVLLTPVNRRTFDTENQIKNSLGDYPEAVRRVAQEENVSLIDLNAMSKPFYEALGPEGSKKAFVDNTHHNNYGSYELAKCVIQGMTQAKLGLVNHLTEDWTAFDPAHPDPVDSFRLPPSPQRTKDVPEGN